MKPNPFSALTAYGLAALVCLMTLSACGTTAPLKDTHPEIAAELPSWPNPPAPKRIRTLRSVTGAQDWGIEKSLLRRLFDALVGGGDEHFVRPSGVAEFQRVLYIADPGAQALWILDGERNQVEKVQRIGDETLLTPVAVAVRPDGAVYLADSRLKTVF